MALTIAFRPSTDTAPHVPGDRRRASFKITFDSSYPTGGEVITAAMFGFTTILYVGINGATSAGKPVYWDGTASSLKVFSAIGTEVADTTNLATESVHLEVVGI
jgi:hypothetical protein